MVLLCHATAQRINPQKNKVIGLLGRKSVLPDCSVIDGISSFICNREVTDEIGPTFNNEDVIQPQTTEIEVLMGAFGLHPGLHKTSKNHLKQKSANYSTRNLLIFVITYQVMAI